MAALICGSLAFDTIMSFEGRFSEQILPDQLHILNVSFLVPALRRGECDFVIGLADATEPEAGIRRRLLAHDRLRFVV